MALRSRLIHVLRKLRVEVAKSYQRSEFLNGKARRAGHGQFEIFLMDILSSAEAMNPNLRRQHAIHKPWVGGASRKPITSIAL